MLLVFQSQRVLNLLSLHRAIYHRKQASNFPGDFPGDFGGEESQGDAEVLFSLPFRCGKAVLFALVDHQHTSPARLFHQASQIQHVVGTARSLPPISATC